MKRVGGLSGYDVSRELEEKILLRLPVKSLIRFRSVCRAWKSLISDRKFVNEHLELQASKTPSSLLLAWVRRDPLDSVNKCRIDVDIPKKQQLSRLSIGDSITSTFVKEEVFLPIRPKQLMHGGFVVPLECFQCNGIICLIDGTSPLMDRIVFYNPALEEDEYVETLPATDCNDCTGGHGFGHDPKTGDYKFIRLLLLKAQVYNLRTRRWREVKLVKDGRISSSGTYLKGRVYWQQFTSWSGVKRNKLVWLDLSDESFGTADMPQLVWTQVMPLLVWKGSLVFLNYVWGSFEMFVMDGEAGRWSRFCRTGNLAVSMPIAFWKDDELLMEGEDGSLMSFNLATKKLTKVPVSINAKHSIGGLYVETLVPVKTRALVDT